MKQLTAARPERRTRLYVLGEWETPVYDSRTSDMHPVDFLLYGPHTELNVVVDIVRPGPSGHFRWSGIWTQTSRRKYTEQNHYELLKHLLVWPEMPTQITPPSFEDRRRSLRYQPISELLTACGIEDAGLTLTVDNTQLYGSPHYRNTDG